MKLFAGYIIGFLDLTLYFLISFFIREKSRKLKQLPLISYYWLTMTVLTGLWETSFVLNYKPTTLYSKQLLLNHTHVWTLDYPSYYILPQNTAYIFYAEYGAYADRNYMLLHNDWSRVIESSHAFFCGLFSLFSLTFPQKHLLLGIAMGSQLMNSLLYMTNYFNQLHEPNSINYITHEFPAGKWLSKRPFMWVNLFWTLMPSIVIVKSLIYKNITTTFDIRHQKSILHPI